MSAFVYNKDKSKVLCSKNSDKFKVILLRCIKGKLYWNRTWDHYSASAIAPKKTYLPMCQISFCNVNKNNGTGIHRKTSYTNEDGSFEFHDVPISSFKPSIKISLEHKDGKVTRIKGFRNYAAESHFKVKRDEVIWGRVDLKGPALEKKDALIDLGEIKIDHAKFIGICDMYNSICYGHKRMKDALANVDLDLVEVRYPLPHSADASYYQSGKIYVLKTDPKECPVILHEYGHFIVHKKIGASSVSGIYDYNKDLKNEHGPESLEYIETAWDEGIATFLSCAIMDKEIYYDRCINLTMNLAKDKIKKGAHCEGSVQGALWYLYAKVASYSLSSKGLAFQTHIWKALIDKTKRTVQTIWDFYDNWKDLALPYIVDFRTCLKDHGMEYRYDYLKDGNMYTKVAAPKTFNKVSREFRKVDELYVNFGIKEGIGSEALKKQYRQEFYNRNNRFNTGALDSGSTPAVPKVTDGKKYMVPVLSKVS